MTAPYPDHHGTGPVADEHWSTACVASARVLRAQGHPDEAADLEDAARNARIRNTTTPDPGADSPIREAREVDAGGHECSGVPPWWI